MSSPIRMRGFNQYSSQHIWSAGALICLLPALEQNADEIKAEVEKGTYTRLLNYRAYVSGAIFSSVAFLEATINELLFMAGDSLMQRTLALPPDDVVALASSVPLVLERRGMSTLDKYQLTLAITRRPNLDPGALPYADAAALIGLRNELIHYVPEWFEPDVKPQKIVARLAGKFRLNPLESELAGDHFLRYLSYGCARWAFESSLDFADEFFARLGMKPHYQTITAPPRSLLP